MNGENMTSSTKPEVVVAAGNIEFGEARCCGFRAMRADGQTNKQTDIYVYKFMLPGC